MLVDGNVYYNSAEPFAQEVNKIVDANFNPDAKIEETDNGVYLSFSLNNQESLKTSHVTTARLGKAKLPKQLFENPDGTPIEIATDYHGNPRTVTPVPGPFEIRKAGPVRIKVW